MRGTTNRTVIIFLFLVFSIGMNAQKRAMSVPSLNKSVMKQLGYGEESFTKKDASTWLLKNGTTVYSTYLYGKKIRGFMGPTPLFIAVDKHKKIVAMAAAGNQESAEYFNKAKVLLKAWNGKTLKEAKNFTPDGITGATYSSNAIIKTVHATAAALAK